MLTRRLTCLALVAALMVGVQVLAAPQAVAGCRLKVRIDPETGAPSGRGALQCPGQDGSGGGGGAGSGRSKPTPTPTPAPYVPAECRRRVGAGAAVDCERVPRGRVPGVVRRGVRPPSEAEVRVVLRLPDPTPRFGPDPGVNEWKMLAVGYPVWLWTDAPTRVSATATHEGLSMTLSAVWTSTTFEMGDGHSRSCTATTVYPERPDRYGVGSPTCGYTYRERSRPGRDYTVTATTYWRVSWSAGGRSGTLTTSYAGQRSLAIGELQALIKG